MNNKKSLSGCKTALINLAAYKISDKKVSKVSDNVFKTLFVIAITNLM